MPTNFRNSSVSSTEVVLTWASPSPVVVNMYTISYRRVRGCTEATSGTDSTSMTTITISGLEENIIFGISSLSTYYNRIIWVLPASHGSTTWIVLISETSCKICIAS